MGPVLTSTAVAKHLQFSADDSQHWDLPDDSDLEEVRREVKNAVQGGGTVSVP